MMIDDGCNWVFVRSPSCANPMTSQGSSDCDQASERERSIVFKIGTQTQTSIELTTSKTDGVLTVVINGKADK